MSHNVNKVFHLPGHVVLPEPALRFGSQDIQAIDIHPLRGLLQYGPYSKNKLSAVSDPIRIAIIAPYNRSGEVLNLLREAEQSHRPVERKAYLLDFPGFSQVFGVKINAPGGHCTVELPPDLTEKMAASA